jgi:hypothetical protein
VREEDGDMHLSLDDISVDLIESTSENEDHYSGRWGWFWHESHMPARGPFRTPTEAVSDFNEWLGTRFPEDPIVTGEAAKADELARLLLENSGSFLKAAETARTETAAGEVVLYGACCGLELVLKAYLASRGLDDDWLRENIRHDLSKAFDAAVFHGLPGDDERLRTFLKVASRRYARHELFELSRERPNLLAETDYLLAVGVLRRQIEKQFEEDRERTLRSRT